MVKEKLLLNYYGDEQAAEYAKFLGLDTTTSDEQLILLVRAQVNEKKKSSYEQSRAMHDGREVFIYALAEAWLEQFQPLAAKSESVYVATVIVNKLLELHRSKDSEIDVWEAFYALLRNKYGKRTEFNELKTLLAIRDESMRESMRKTGHKEEKGTRSLRWEKRSPRT